MKTYITIEFENDKALRDFLTRKLNDLYKLIEGEKTEGIFLTWEEPLA